MNSTLAIMQPYFFPYIGYFQLIAAADIFIVYDNIEFTKKGWINRNRILQNGNEKLFSLQLKKDSDFLHVRDRLISPDFSPVKMLNQIKGAYRKAPYFEQTYPLLERVIMDERSNLFDYIYNSITLICQHLNIDTQIKVSSTIPIDHSLKNKEKVIALCKSVKASTYINPIGGIDLYEKSEFKTHGINLQFIKANNIEYSQFDNDFIPCLSIIDVMMFNSKEHIAENIMASSEIK